MDLWCWWMFLRKHWIQKITNKSERKFYTLSLSTVVIWHDSSGTSYEFLRQHTQRTDVWLCWPLPTWTSSRKEHCTTASGSPGTLAPLGTTTGLRWPNVPGRPSRQDADPSLFVTTNEIFAIIRTMLIKIYLSNFWWSWVLIGNFIKSLFWKIGRYIFQQ